MFTWQTRIAGQNVTLTLTGQQIADDMEAQREQARLLAEFIREEKTALAREAAAG